MNSHPASAPLRRISKVLLPTALLFALVAGAVSGCGRVKEDKIAMALDSAVNGYRESIRWGYFDAAIGFIHPTERGDLDTETLENIRVTGYEVVQPPVITPDYTAVQLVRIEYVLEDEQRLKDLMDRQEWRYDEDGAGWWLYTGMPAFDG
jgi:hypothetical protein